MKIVCSHDCYSFFKSRSYDFRAPVNLLLLKMQDLATILTAFVVDSSDDEQDKEPEMKYRKVYTKDWISRRHADGAYKTLLYKVLVGEFIQVQFTVLLYEFVTITFVIYLFTF